MIAHYIKSFYRSFRRNLIYNVTGILSLTLGLAFCLIIFIYLWIGVKPPTFHTHFDNMYQVEAVTQSGQSVRMFQPGFVDYLREQVPEVSQVTAYRKTSGYINSGGLTNFEQLWFVDSSFFDVYSFTVLKGNPAAMQNSTNQVMVSEQLARKIFGEDSPLGKSVTIDVGNNVSDFFVAGIIKDPPYSSVMNVNIILPLAYLNQFQCKGSEFSDDCIRTVTMVSRGATASQLSELLTERSEAVSSILGLQGEQRFTGFEIEPRFNKVDLFNSATLSIFLLCLGILILSCINYINNSIAVASTRIKEIGLRKVFGINRKGIATQFLVETALTTSTAFLLSILIVELIRPYINRLLGAYTPNMSAFSLEPLMEPAVIGTFILLLLITILLSGLYPALYVARFDPSLILKNQTKTGGGARFSKVLVGFQLMFGLILMVLVLNIWSTVSDSARQIYGAAASDTWVINVMKKNPGSAESNYSAYERFRILAKNGSEPVRVGGIRGRILNTPQVSLHEAEREFSARIFQVDPHFFKSMKMSFLLGEDDPRLNKPVQRDSSLAVVNRILANQIGFSGQNRTEALLNLQGKEIRVIGIVDTFTGLQSQKRDTPILFLLTPPEGITQGVVNLSETKAPNKVLNDQVRTWWQQAGDTDEFYTPVPVPDPMQDFKMFVNMAGITAGVALLFTFIGLFSLANFSVSKRLQEISIRKVNGATQGQIVRLLTMDYMKIGLIAFLLALPLGYIASNWILTLYVEESGNFFLLFLYSAICLVTFILGCVAYQVYRASNVNPIRYLKDE